MVVSRDLTNPFTGRYKVRRTTTTAVLIKIRNEVVSVMGAQRMTQFDRAFGRQKTLALRDYLGVELPADNQL